MDYYFLIIITFIKEKMFTKTYKKILFFSFFLIFLTSCGKDFFKYSSAKDNPVRGLVRAKKNVDEGRGVLGPVGMFLLLIVIVFVTHQHRPKLNRLYKYK